MSRKIIPRINQVELRYVTAGTFVCRIKVQHGRISQTKHLDIHEKLSDEPESVKSIAGGNPLPGVAREGETNHNSK